MKCRFCMYDFYVTNGIKGKDEKWREINIIALAGPLVSFGESRLSTITAQSLPRNPELTKRKPGLSFLFFSSPSLSLAFSRPFCFSLSPLLFVPLRFVPSAVCSPEGIFKAVLIHLQAPERRHRAALRDSFSLFGVRILFTVGVSLD